MTIDRNSEGAWRISEFTNGADSYLVTKTYYGYTKRDAIRLFRKQMRELESKC